MWLLCGYCVATVWLLCGYCVATVWLLCGDCVATMWLLCGYCVAAVLHIVDTYGANVDEIPSQCERTKSSFANMLSFTILPPSPPQSMLGTIAHQDLDEKERFFRIGSTAKMRQH